MAKKWIKLGDLPKKDRIFRIVNLGYNDFTIFGMRRACNILLLYK